MALPTTAPFALQMVAVTLGAAASTLGPAVTLGAAASALGLAGFTGAFAATLVVAAGAVAVAVAAAVAAADARLLSPLAGASSGPPAAARLLARAESCRCSKRWRWKMHSLPIGWSSRQPWPGSGQG